MKETKEFLEDLRGSYDPEPEAKQRELDRLDSLCQEAAERLEMQTTMVETLTAALQYLNDDPFRILSRIDVGEHIEKKGGLNYLSWAWAWDTIMRFYPDTETGINRPESGLPYWTDGRTCWVDVYATIKWNGRERTRSEVFPIMDHRNNSLPLEKVTSFDINTALQRAWTKCIARHGLGFYIYAGQDLPNEKAQEEKKKRTTPATPEQVEKVRELYTEDEIQRMFANLKVNSFGKVTQAQAEKMINSRDRSLVNDQTETF